MIISSSDLQSKGVSLIEATLLHNQEALISVEGQGKYVIMNIEHYNYMRECELLAALNETVQDLEQGNFSQDSVENHMKRVLGHDL
jgi:hypothetical protein